jgi:hypothetical protein
LFVYRVAAILQIEKDFFNVSNRYPHGNACFFGISFFLTRYLHKITLPILLGLLVFPEGMATAA